MDGIWERLTDEERLKLVEANMDGALTLALDPDIHPKSRADAHEQASRWGIIAMELRSRIGLRRG